MSAHLLGSDFRLIPGESDDVFPADGCEANADQFIGRTIDELVEGQRILIGLLMEKRLHGEITATGRDVCARERQDIIDELREHYTRVANGGGISADARRIADKGRRAYRGDL